MLLHLSRHVVDDVHDEGLFRCASNVIWVKALLPSLLLSSFLIDHRVDIKVAEESLGDALADGSYTIQGSIRNKLFSMGSLT